MIFHQAACPVRVIADTLVVGEGISYFPYATQGGDSQSNLRYLPSYCNNIYHCGRTEPVFGDDSIPCHAPIWGSLDGFYLFQKDPIRFIPSSSDREKRCLGWPLTGSLSFQCLQECNTEVTRWLD